jgi:hypothetical protein
MWDLERPDWMMGREVKRKERKDEREETKYE